MLFAYPIIDRQSYALAKYAEDAMLDLDEAAGEHVELILAGGDPAQSGPIHQGLRSDKLRRSDARDTKKYVEEIYRTGRKRFHRLREMKALQKGLGLSSKDVPCIAFLTRTGSRPAGVLRIAPSWYESATSLGIFDECLRGWLGSDDMKRLATAQMEEAEVTERLGRMLAALTAGIKSRSGSRSMTPAAVMSAAERGMVHFETPTAATWGDVRIRFVDGHTVAVQVLGVKGRFNYTQMGMADLRTSNPTVQWKLLETLSNRNGSLRWGDAQAGRQVEKRIERLARSLSLFFRIKGRPFELDHDRMGWHARFALLPDR